MANETTSPLGKESGGTTNRWQEQLGYAYDAAGNLNYRTNNVLVQTFAVNSLNQINTATRSGTMTVAGTTTSAATNVTVNTLAAIRYADNTFARTNLTLSDGNNTFTAIAQDNAGRVDTNAVTVNLPATVTLASDKNGNLCTNGTRLLEWDDENQLTRVTEPNSWKSEFTYDGKMRQRVRKEYQWVGSAWILTAEVRYVYDGKLVVQERDALNLPTVAYTRGRDLSGSLEGAGGIGGLLARTDNPSTLISQPSTIPHAYYHADGNGNVTMLVQNNQTVAAKYVYDPYGGLLSLAGPLAEANLYRFSSKELHAASGLVYFLYRFYEPNLQRWLNREPLGDQATLTPAILPKHVVAEAALGSSLYFPFRNDPVNSSDSDGRIVPLIVCAVVAGVLVCGCSKKPDEPKNCWDVAVGNNTKAPGLLGRTAWCTLVNTGCLECCRERYIPGPDVDYATCATLCESQYGACLVEK